MPEGNKPNVLLINTDHWSAPLMGCAGARGIMTPTLDQLAADGIRFTNILSDCPVCIPARRSLMTGMTPRSHGDRVYTDFLPLPPVKTLAQCFRDAGYQAFAVGKLHVYPQRDRIGFDDVILCEEARYYLGAVDDYQLWLADHGFLGQEYMHGMSNNEYYTRPWHLSEEAHNTNWTTNEMIRTIKRRDPHKPLMLYLSYIHPHPPLVPLQCYWDMYEDIDIPEPVRGDWLEEDAAYLRLFANADEKYTPADIRRARRAFYAQCTHIDHQMRLVIGTLREEGLLQNTIIGFVSDHGDMLFDHNMVAKRCFYRGSANVPLILTGNPLEKYAGTVSDTLGTLEDVMPTLLELCGLPVPETVEGKSLLGDGRPEMVFGEISEGLAATRMAADARYKLIYYPYGNLSQLFDMQEDPEELHNLASDPALASVRERLTAFLIAHLHGGDESWVKDGKLCGLPNPNPIPVHHNYGLTNQRGGHWPTPPHAQRMP